MHLHWFRTDLRISDNTALSHAASQGATIAVYIITPQQWQQHHDAACKIDFWRRNLEQLSKELEKRCIPLLIRQCDTWQDVPNLLLNLCQQHHIQTVHCNAEYAVNEKARDETVQQLLATHQIKFETHHDQLLFVPGSIQTKKGTYFKVFGQFKRVCQQQLYEHVPELIPKLHKQKPIDLKSDKVPEFSGQFAMENPELIKHWPAGEKAALSRLKQFTTQHLADYHTARDFPAQDGTSRLSAYLAAGVLSVRQCLHAAMHAIDGELFSKHEGFNVWLDELLWRDFYQHIVVGFPQVSRHQPFKAKTQKLAWRHAPDDLKSWQDGKTGFPLIDAAMQQLKTIGWMHNRMRMIVAMFLTKNLLIDWREGERWFMQHLIDGDLAANNGGWQWSASTGTDSVPYFRIFNPITQSQRFDPEGKFIRTWLPELAHLDNKAIHAPYAKMQKTKNNSVDALDYPKPIVDIAESRDRALEAFSVLKD